MYFLLVTALLAISLISCSSSFQSKLKAWRSSHQEKMKLFCQIRGSPTDSVASSLSYACLNFLIRSGVCEIYFNILGFLLSPWGKGFNSRVQNILYQSGVRGDCTVLLLHSNEYISYSLTTLSGRHYLGISSRILLDMTTDELSAIINHEAGHIKHRDHKGKSRIMFVTYFFIDGLIGLSMVDATLLSALTVRSFSSSICQLILEKYAEKGNRRSQFLADMHSAVAMGSPQPLISALKKIESKFNSDAANQEEEKLKWKESKQRRSLRQKISHSWREFWRSPDQIPNEQALIKDRILKLQRYARSIAWYAPAVKLLGMEETFGFPKTESE